MNKNSFLVLSHRKKKKTILHADRTIWLVLTVGSDSARPNSMKGRALEDGPQWQTAGRPRRLAGSAKDVPTAVHLETTKPSATVWGGADTTCGSLIHMTDGCRVSNLNTCCLQCRFTGWLRSEQQHRSCLQSEVWGLMLACVQNPWATLLLLLPH